MLNTAFCVTYLYFYFSQMLWLLLYVLNSALLNRSGHKYLINVLFRFTREIFVYILFHFGIKAHTNLFTLWKYQCGMNMAFQSTRFCIFCLFHSFACDSTQLSTFFSLFRFECHQTRSTLVRLSLFSVSFRFVLCMGVWLVIINLYLILILFVLHRNDGDDYQTTGVFIISS